MSRCLWCFLLSHRATYVDDISKCCVGLGLTRANVVGPVEMHRSRTTVGVGGRATDLLRTSKHRTTERDRDKLQRNGWETRSEPLPVARRCSDRFWND